MKHTKIKTNHGLIIIIVFIFLFGLVIYLLGNTNKTYVLQTTTGITSKSDTENFQSKDLRFTITIPSLYTVREGQTYVEVLLNGVITFDIVRNGTNFESLDTYLKDSDIKKKLTTVTDEKTLTINGHRSASRIETNAGSKIKQKLYYIYVDNWVYILSTSSESLFPDLDQIAQSFRYTPEIENLFKISTAYLAFNFAFAFSFRQHSSVFLSAGA